MPHHNDNFPQHETIGDCAHETLRSLLATEDILLNTYPERLRRPIGAQLQTGKLTLAIAMSCSLHGHEHTRRIFEQVMADLAPAKHAEPTP